MGTCAARSARMAPDHGSRRAFANPGSHPAAAAHAVADCRPHATAHADANSAAHADANSTAHADTHARSDPAAAHAGANSRPHAVRSLSQG